MQKHQRPVCNKGRVATDACLDFPPRPRARTRSALSLALASHECRMFYRYSCQIAECAVQKNKEMWTRTCPRSTRET